MSAFGAVLCAVDGSRADPNTVRQAVALAGSGRLTLVTVAYQAGVGLAAQAALTPDHARQAVEDAGRVALAEGHRDPRSKVVRGRDAAAALLEEAAGHDLLVVGGSRISRAGGIALGRTSSALVHRAAVPVLVARRPPRGEVFARKLLLASDGSKSSVEAAHVTARIAGSRPAHVLVLRVGSDRDSSERRRLAAETAEILEATGTEPVSITESGDAHRRIVEVAERERVSLVIVGSRGVGGIKALGSVSERVVHRAPCSVLVARQPAGR